MIKVKNIKIRELNIWERIYIPEIIRGLGVTLRHLFSNLLNPSSIPTISYPEEKVLLPGHAKERSRHRIKLRKDGTPKCVACMLCATICPAKCIHIEAGETENFVEKYPKKFDIDLSRCVMCGLCVEACPEDAIIMDTEEIPGGAKDRNASYGKDGLYATKEQLFEKKREISTFGAANRLANEFLLSKERGNRND